MDCYNGKKTCGNIVQVLKKGKLLCEAEMSKDGKYLDILYGDSSACRKELEKEFGDG